MSRRVVNDLCRLQENNPFIRGLVTWVGYSQTGVLYDRETTLQAADEVLHWHG